MPFKGFICELTGEPVAPGDCLACAKSGAPGCEIGTPALIAGITHNQRPPDFSGVIAGQQRPDLKLDLGVSVTELLSCARRSRLAAEYDWWEKPTRLYAAYRGVLFHEQAGAYASAETLALGEERLYWFLRFQGKMVGLSGQPDLLIYEPGAGWRIVDYKTTKEVPGRAWRYICTHAGSVIYELPFKVKREQVKCPWCLSKHPIAADDVTVEQVTASPHKSHIEQVQLYALLIEKNAAALAERIRAKSGGQVDIDPNAPVIGAEVVYLDMSAQKRFPVEVWPLEQRRSLLKERLALHLQTDLPAVLDHPHELWLCDYCPVRSVCSQTHGGPVGKEMLEARFEAAAQSRVEQALAELY